jgi:hypothetical protein
MKVGDLIEWTVNGDIGVIVKVNAESTIGFGLGLPEIQVQWSNGRLDYFFTTQDGLKVLS